MGNEKLMKIVQAVNDSKGEPLDIDQPNYMYVAYSKGGQSFNIGEVHVVNDKATLQSLLQYWDVVCTVEEFKQCVKEMSAGYDKKESDIKDNKHPHHDLIVEWAKDVSKKIELKNLAGEFVSDRHLSINNVIDDSFGTFEFRFKPREFVKGHWYPCIDSCNEHIMYMYTGEGFTMDGADDACIDQDSEMNWIGESLGEINFGGGE